MRVSFRGAAKFTAVVLVVIITNLLICYEVSDSLATHRGERSSGGSKNVWNDNDGHFGVEKEGVQNVRMQVDNTGENHIFNISSSGSVMMDVNSLSNIDKVPMKSIISIRETELSDLFISVKTTGINHQTRLRTLLETWILLAREQTHVFTDADDPKLSHETGVNIINTRCLPAHTRQALCCKMAIEYDTFLESKKRWFCHVDDDNYINIPQLVKLLRKYNHTNDWYLGKPSLKKPIEIMDRRHKAQKIAFWFATGGAGICISRGMALKMMPYASGGRLMTVGESIRLPDDCTIGYIIGHLLKKELTVIDQFHSHLESLNLVKRKDLRNQITFSYKESDSESKDNVVKVSGFNRQQDPSRLRSLHCFLFPTFRECKGIELDSL